MQYLENHNLLVKLRWILLLEIPSLHVFLSTLLYTLPLSSTATGLLALSFTICRFSFRQVELSYKKIHPGIIAYFVLSCLPGPVNINYFTQVLINLLRYTISIAVAYNLINNILYPELKLTTSNPTQPKKAHVKAEVLKPSASKKKELKNTTPRVNPFPTYVNRDSSIPNVNPVLTQVHRDSSIPNVNPVLTQAHRDSSIPNERLLSTRNQSSTTPPHPETLTKVKSHHNTIMGNRLIIPFLKYLTNIRFSFDFKLIHYDKLEAFKNKISNEERTSPNIIQLRHPIKEMQQPLQLNLASYSYREVSITAKESKDSDKANCTKILSFIGHNETISELLRKPNLELICPITYELISQPVVAKDGNTYEYDTLSKFFRNTKQEIGRGIDRIISNYSGIQPSSKELLENIRSLYTQIDPKTHIVSPITRQSLETFDPDTKRYHIQLSPSLDYKTKLLRATLDIIAKESGLSYASLLEKINPPTPNRGSILSLFNFPPNEDPSITLFKNLSRCENKLIGQLLKEEKQSVSKHRP